MDLSQDWDYIVKTAMLRLENNRTRSHISDYGTDIEVMGAAGELAARRYFGLKAVLHKNFDGGHDFKVGRKRVDVKATKLTPNLEYRFLQWSITKRIACDIVLLTAVDIRLRAAVIVGWATAKTMMAAPVNQERAYPCHEIPVPDLREPWLLYSRGMTYINPDALQPQAQAAQAT
jgi:hypothetical protein